MKERNPTVNEDKKILLGLAMIDLLVVAAIMTTSMAIIVQGTEWQ